MAEVGFSHPWLLLLVLIALILPLLRLLPVLRRRGLVSLATYEWMPAFARSSAYPLWLADSLRIAALICLVFIAAGIRSGRAVTVEAGQPEALVILLDVSSSMTAEDFSPGNRLEAAKELLTEFAPSHANAELGLILLAASPRLMFPVTPEEGALPQALKKVSPAGYGEDGTAIGSGIASAINRLRDLPWRRRRILLITDGVNNRGALAPADAARIAASMGVRIDTVGIGTDSVLRYWVPSQQGPPVEVNARIQIDDKALEEVSRITGGNYKRVTNSDELRGALKSLEPGGRQIPADVSARRDLSPVRLLAAVSVVFIVVEFVLTRFAYPELPG
ncbi:MAG: VWA domain-containing protein [Acidobacteriia bacterium]|nr:VWA domain-containing protein [Terriglobia bacterium]